MLQSTHVLGVFLKKYIKFINFWEFELFGLMIKAHQWGRETYLGPQGMDLVLRTLPSGMGSRISP